ncbi:MAG: radical SAM protein [Pirellulales bacterium]|nr:radical SAM protein [Pirellulales bacterium]
MHIVLFDTRRHDVSKDFAGGFGVGRHPGTGGVRGWIIRRFFTRDRRPTALVFAYLAAIFRRLGHTVEYAEDRLPAGGDLYVFCPALLTLALERRAIGELLEKNPSARVFVVGLLASVVPEAFADLKATVIKGEPEQLLWKLEEVLAHPRATVQLGAIDDLDRLPPPDWSAFDPGRFRVSYDFWRFPTAYIVSSRGCTFQCNYCPYILLDNAVRLHSPEAVADEIVLGIRRWGFRSFKFRDPLFGANRSHAERLIETIGGLPRKIQFSIETRIELLPAELLRELQRVGLTSVTVGVETPHAGMLKNYRRAAAGGDRQREFVETCRALGIRTVASFMIGFPDDTEASIAAVESYARELNPTYANFNAVTPYPGTAFYENEKRRGRIADFDFSRYSSYAPVMKCEHLTAAELERLHARCFNRFFFRWDYLRDNAALLWPPLQRLGLGRKSAAASLPATLSADMNDSAPLADANAPHHPGIPRPKSGLEVLKSKGFRADGPHVRIKTTGEQ